MRIGFGYDSHELVKGKPLFLGGIKIPFHLGLKGYSDGDVLIHAIMDSLLGASGLPDIGNLFPAGKPKYKNISSLVLLEKVKNLIKSEKLINIDCVIICQKPQLNQYISQMKEKIASVLRIKKTQITLKAKHPEGSKNSDKKIEAFAVCLVK